MGWLCWRPQTRHALGLDPNYGADPVFSRLGIAPWGLWMLLLHWVGARGDASPMPRTPSRMGSPILVNLGTSERGQRLWFTSPAHLLGLGGGGTSLSLWSPCARWPWAPKWAARPHCRVFLITLLSLQAAGTGLHRDTLHHGRAARDGGSQPHGGCQGWVSLVLK